MNYTLGVLLLLVGLIAVALTVADRVRANVNTMFAQIIFLTARVGETDRERALQAGAYGYLTKPFKPDELLRMIEGALADRQF